MTAFEILGQYPEALFNGLLVTIALYGVSVVCGATFGFLLSTAVKPFSFGHFLIAMLSRIMAALPVLVIMFWAFYSMPPLTGLILSPFWTAAACLTLVHSFSIWQIVDDARQNFPSQYLQTARVCGLTPIQILLYIQFPIMLRLLVPRVLDQHIVIFQTTILASLISVDELFRAAQRINSEIYQPTVVYSAMALVFVLILVPALLLSDLLRSRWNRDWSER